MSKLFLKLGLKADKLSALKNKFGGLLGPLLKNKTNKSKKSNEPSKKTKKKPFMPSNKVLGIYISDRKIYVSLTEKGIVNKKIKKHEELEYEEGNFDALKEKLSSIQKKYEKYYVLIGISPDCSFFLSTQNKKDPKASESVSMSVFKAGASLREDLAIDWCETKVQNSIRIVHSGACLKKIITRIMSVWEDDPDKLIRIEPAFWSLAKYSYSKKRPNPLKPEPEIRLFEDSEKYIVVLCYGSATIAWVMEERVGKDDIELIKVAVKQVLSYAKSRIDDMNISKLIYFSKNIDKKLVEKLEDETEFKITTSKFDEITGSFLAFCTALGKSDKPEDIINFAKKFQRPVAWTRLFPKEKIILLALIGNFLAYVIANQYLDGKNKLELVNVRNRAIKWAHSIGNGTLVGNRKKLSAFTTEVDGFLNNRIVFSPFLKSISEVLPDNTWVERIEFSNKHFVKGVSKKKGTKYLVIRGATIFPDGIRAPEEIELTLAAFKNTKVIKDIFSNITLDSVIWKRDGATDIAYFRIECMPKETGGSKKKK